MLASDVSNLSQEYCTQSTQITCYSNTQSKLVLSPWVIIITPPSNLLIDVDIGFCLNCFVNFSYQNDKIHFLPFSLFLLNGEKCQAKTSFFYLRVRWKMFPVMNIFSPRLNFIVFHKITTWISLLSILIFYKQKDF